MPTHRRRTAVATTILISIATWTMPGPAQAESGTRKQPPITLNSSVPHRLTLLSGDVVTVRPGPGRTILEASPGPGREGMRFLRRMSGGEESIIPADAVSPLARGILDPRLFNVTRLIAEHRDDVTTSHVPVILRYSTGRAASRARAATRAAVSVSPREISGVDMTVASVSKARAGAFWSEVISSKPSTTGIAKVWLDGSKHRLLDKSVPQIGAPIAWAAGFTGKGVKVAILDSGYDASHPDLRDRVSVSEDFTGLGESSDKVGHGTHVASIIGGSGAASSGRYRGVAPDADLIVGRVCTDEVCSDSTILAGMQWAVSQGARIVNMSLGGADTAEIDPVEEAVNTLTARSGTLFVVAAGNEGAAEKTVDSPASADAALAVAAVDRQDKVAQFSSRGPRIGDYGLKPDLAAPGVDIQAARAIGTLADHAVDAKYAKLSGTSMASPHVAGAAAILAQKHPNWKAADLKAALMSSAASTPDGVLDVGAGRVDVARAIDQPVFASPSSLSFGQHLWPHTAAHDKPVTKAVTFHSDATHSITLLLALTATAADGSPAPDGMFIAPRKVTIAAGGATAVPLLVNTAVVGPDGQYTGVLVATSLDGSSRIRTPLAVYREPESYDLTLSVKDRADHPADTFVEMIKVGSGGTDPLDYLSVPVSRGPTTVRVPKGSWNLATAIADAVPDDSVVPITLAGFPALRMNRPRKITLAARAGRPVEVQVPDRSARLGTLSAGITIGPKSYPGGWEVFGTAGPSVRKVEKLYAVPSYTRSKDFLFWSMTQWARPNHDDFADSPYQYNVFLPTVGRIPGNLATKVRRSELATVAEDHARPTAETNINVYPFAGFGNKSPGGLVGQFPFSARRRISYYTTAHRQIKWQLSVWAQSGDITLMREECAELRYRAGVRRTERWSHPVLGPAFPDLGDQQHAYVRRYQTDLTARIPLLSDGTPGHYGFSSAGRAGTELFLNGRSLGKAQTNEWVRFGVPAGAGAYRLVAQANIGTSFGGFSSQISGEWSFHSQAPGAGMPATVPSLTAVQYLPKLDSDGRATMGPLGIPLRLTSTVPDKKMEVASVLVDVSADGGRTWKSASVKHHDAHWTAAVDHSYPSGTWISLRSKTVDASGNTSKQTVLNAYRVR
jgi:subtilisin family serine protease